MGKKIYKIHPGIGIARLGNSDNEFFIGPEAPGVRPLPNADYHDNEGNIKRQGARFRVYEFEYGETGSLTGVKEVTSDDAEITWSVHLVNKKAAARRFPPQESTSSDTGFRMRNKDISDRGSLIIDADDQEAPPAGQMLELKGEFLGKPVKLGELTTDDKGRLVVLGGHGRSGSVPPNYPRDNEDDYANTKFWHDDVSDGKVTASVKFEGLEPIEAKFAWVVVAPPSYAPLINNVVTWYDQALNIAEQQNANYVVTAPISFTEHVYPILKRTMDLQWVSWFAFNKHIKEKKADFSVMMSTLSNNTDEAMDVRVKVFTSLAAPNGPKINIMTLPTKMPYFYSGVNPEKPTEGIAMSLTPRQHKILEVWSLGSFKSDWKGNAPAPRQFSVIPENERPGELDRAALDACIGGPFCPGIECGYKMALKETYEGPFRISDDMEPGDLSAEMALPWQADFRACSDLWWPAQRPNSVFRKGEENPHRWGEGVDVFKDWAKLNFVLKENGRYLEKPHT